MSRSISGSLWEGSKGVVSHSAEAMGSFMPNILRSQKLDTSGRIYNLLSSGRSTVLSGIRGIGGATLSALSKLLHIPFIPYPGGK